MNTGHKAFVLIEDELISGLLFHFGYKEVPEMRFGIKIAFTGCIQYVIVHAILEKEEKTIYVPVNT